MPESDDLVFAPAYNVADAARYLQLSRSTLRAWIGQLGERMAVLDVKHEKILSFAALLEAHIVSSMRRQYEIPLLQIRRAMEYLSERQESGPEWNRRHPLIGKKFKTNGKELFIEYFGGDLVAVSKGGQIAMKDILDLYLTRIVYGESGLPEQFYPFTISLDLVPPENQPKVVMMTPRVGFGRPILAASGVRTSAIAERFKGGESIKSLAEDFATSEDQIEVAIRLAA